ncbi:MAG: hypothetical protein WC595_03440 [Candidatus Nanoarchaeia archaeon]
MSGQRFLASAIIYKPGEGILLARRSQQETSSPNTLSLPFTYLTAQQGKSLSRLPDYEDIRPQLTNAVRNQLGIEVKLHGPVGERSGFRGEGIGEDYLTVVDCLGEMTGGKLKPNGHDFTEAAFMDPFTSFIGERKKMELGTQILLATVEAELDFFYPPPGAKKTDLHILSAIGASQHQPTKPTYAIRIHSTNAQLEPRPFVPSLHYLHIKEYTFDDNDTQPWRIENGPQWFTSEMAKDIIEGISSTRSSIESVIIHCSAGKNRSPGVARALNEIFSFGHLSALLRGNYPNANHHVYQTLKEAAKKHL